MQDVLCISLIRVKGQLLLINQIITANPGSNHSHSHSLTHTHIYLSQILKAASNQRMRTVFICHLHRVLNQTEQLNSHLVDINNPAEDTVHVLMQISVGD